MSDRRAPGLRPVPTRREDRPRFDESGADAVARYVRTAVFDGRLVAGQRLPQDEIAAAVGVSRIPLREALIVLEREGWIRTRPHRGSFVNDLDDDAVLDRFALYGRFYGFAARRVIEHGDDDTLAALHALAAKVRQTSTPVAFEKASNAYMSTLVLLAGSARLRGVLRSTTQIVPGSFFAAVPASIPIQREGVQDLQRAIDGRDANEASAICERLEHRHALEVIGVMRSRRDA